MFITFVFISLLIIILFAININFAYLDNISDNILDKNYTTQIRGIAISFIMISHLLYFVYLYPNSNINFYWEKIIMFFIFTFTNISVGIFFFLSGYGNWFSITNKENKNLWVINKLLKIYIPVGILIILSYISTKFLNLNNLFPYWWTPIRNFFYLSTVMWSFWFLKVLAMSYIILFTVEKYIKKNKSIIISFLFLFYIIFCLYLGIESRWWFTSLCFPAGCLFAEHKNLYIKIFSKVKIWLDTFLISLLILILFLFKSKIIMIFISLLACIIVIKSSCFLNFKSKIFKYMGKYSLELYLIHLTLIPIIRNLRLQSLVISDSILKFLLILSISIIFSPILQNMNNKLLNIFHKGFSNAKKI